MDLGSKTKLFHHNCRKNSAGVTFNPVLHFTTSGSGSKLKRQKNRIQIRNVAIKCFIWIRIWFLKNMVGSGSNLNIEVKISLKSIFSLVKCNIVKYQLYGLFMLKEKSKMWGKKCVDPDPCPVFSRKSDPDPGFIFKGRIRIRVKSVPIRNPA